MHRIDHETATSDHKFTEGNPTIPVPATVVTGAWLNAVQEELVAAITGAGLELEKSDNTQLWQAISQTITTAVDNARPGLATKKKPGLVQIGNGLAITTEGLLSVLIASTSQAGLVKPRYGLKIGKDGSLDVDFGDMPTDKFEELLKSIRVPIWLTKSKNFYVNGTTGSDVLDEGRGESEAKPFKTIQAAINYVTSDYNINIYVATIRIADGVYTEDIKLSKYTSTTGVVQLRGNASDRGRVVIKGCIWGGQSLGRWDVQYITIKNKPGATSIGSFNYFGVLSQNGTTIEIFNCAIDVSEAAPEGGIKVPVHAGGGEIQIRTLDGTAGLSVVDDGEGETSRILYGTLAGNIMMAADIDLMNVSVSVAVLFLSNLSVFTLVSSGGTLPKFTGSATGKRYDVRENSIAAVLAQGPDFIPGTIAGTTSTGGQYT